MRNSSRDSRKTPFLKPKNSHLPIIPSFEYQRPPNYYKQIKASKSTPTLSNTQKIK